MSFPDLPKRNNGASEIEKKSPSLSIGLYRPEYALTNEEIESWGVTTSSGKPLTAASIEDLIGVKKRYVANDSETPLRMGLEAAYGAVCGKPRADVLLVSTSFPTGEDLASRINSEFGLGVDQGERVNIHMACSGFAAGLAYLYERRLDLNGARVLFVSTEKYSPHLQDLRDKDALKIDPWLSQTIFSDMASATAFTLGQDLKILSSGSRFDFTDQENRYIGMPIDYEKLQDGGACIVKDVPTSPTGKIYQDGPHVFKTMVRQIPPLVSKVLMDAGMTYADIAAILTHQGSKRMTDGIENNLPGDNSHIRRDQEDGNASSVAIPRLLKREIDEGRLFAGERIVMAGFGAGLMASASVVELG